ncbi:hypothetical protein ACFS5N_17455 [Mucilaginibacter ximonensis]|uniref:Outer membrane protein beta-barrel domain-containing protein n=1 Tax=Mucilaginibacter ximonensis TaxID=538021 RepID=A0ABW5YFW6_9SPHI
MRNWNQYLKLWQQKRNELHIDTKVQDDWSAMHQLLDKHMPLTNQPANGNKTGNSSGDGGLSTGAKLLNLAKFKLLYATAGLIIGSGITYFAIHYINQKPPEIHKETKARIDKDSIVNSNALKTDDQKHTTDDSSTDNSKQEPGTPLGVDETAKSAAGYNAHLNKTANNDITDKRLSSSVKNNGANSGLIPANHTHLQPNHATYGNNSVSGAHRGASSSAKNSRILLAKNAARWVNNGATGSHGRQNVLSPGDNRPNQTNNVNTRWQNNGYDGSKLAINATPPLAALIWDEITAGTDSRTSAEAIFNKSINASRQGAGTTSAYRNLKTNLPATKRAKAAKAAWSTKLDWGILAGTDGLGTWTPKSQNHNFYGSLPADIYLGLFGTYNVNDRWAVGLQSRFLVPHAVSGTYTYPGASETILISDSRKVYTIDVPIHLIYKPVSNISLKAGPLLSIQAKTANGTFPNAANDSTGTKSPITQALNATSMSNKVQLGASAGVGFSYKFLWLDATYNYYTKGQKISSSLGGYSANMNSLQLTIGIKLNKSKK